jgi:hypothetical protein
VIMLIYHVSEETTTRCNKPIKRSIELLVL